MALRHARWLLTGIALLVVAGCAGTRTMRGTGPAKRLEVGASLVKTDHAMRNVDGKDIRIADVKGTKGTLLVVTCNHCPWSKAWEARITALGNRFMAEGVGVVALNPNDPQAYPEDSFPEMQDRANEAGMKFPYVVDAGGVVSQALGATKTPEIFLFDAEGKLVYVGAVDDNANRPDSVSQPYLQNALEALVQGRSPDPQTTKALGCSIKL